MSETVPDPTPDEERELYRHMVRSRALDVELVRWQRQGIIPAFPPAIGQEAAQVGAAAAIDPSRDFAFPMYRELGVAVALGVDMTGYLGNHNGNWGGGSHDPHDKHFTPIQSVVGANSPHAAGWALGQQIDGTDGVAIAFIGDGGSSEGDTHEAMNWAGVFGLPVVFFVTNNQWAISTPLTRQVAGGSVAARAAGYGFPGVTVDGDDVLAVRAATLEAFARARRGEGPTLIEAMTYRRGPHATSDDPGRYRTLEEERRDGGQDPLERYRDSVRARGLIDDAFEATLDAEVAEWLESIRDYHLTLTPRDGSEMFEHIYAEPTTELVEELAQWRKAAQA